MGHLQLAKPAPILHQTRYRNRNPIWPVNRVPLGSSSLLPSNRLYGDTDQKLHRRRASVAQSWRGSRHSTGYQPLRRLRPEALLRPDSNRWNNGNGPHAVTVTQLSTMPRDRPEFEPPRAVRWTFYPTPEHSPVNSPPVKFLAVVTGHYITTAVAQFRLIVKLSLKPRDVRNRLLSLTITPTVYSTCHIMDSLHVSGCTGFR